MIRDAASQNQVDAANPNNSTWVAANAGSGKTRVLTDRVARLLLQDVDPQNILCLTYTKAAAIEMQNRLFKRLGAWAMMKREKLEDDLAQLGFERTLNDEAISNARTLFARAIETPGGLKIQTIHSFCSSLLRRFPLEAGVSPQFREMEDQTAARLRTEVLDAMAEGPDAALTKAFLAEFTGADLDALLSEITRRKAKFSKKPEPTELAVSVEISPNRSIADCYAEALTKDDKPLAQDISEAFSTQSSSYQKFARDLLGLNFDQPSEADFEKLKTLFLYSKDKSSKSANFPQSNHGKAVEAAAPIIDDLHAWMDRVAALHQEILGHNALNRTQALYNFAVPFVKAYEAQKRATGQLDFDDLIGKANSLLSNRDVAQWVLYRLDGGIDHVLVDEAQDTSPDQWNVIRALTHEFTSGEGARKDENRTIFVVGDKQQSIYSFQGADPKAFDNMQAHFRSSLENVGKTLEDVKLSHSFRSSHAILGTVDKTFTDEKAHAIGKVQDHIAFNAAMPGRVDLWPVIETVKQDDDIDWTDPIDQMSEGHHIAQLADQVADQIKHMIDHETLPVKRKDSDGYDHRRITAGDIMILVQRRSDIFHEIIAACKRRGIPIAGADRLRVGAVLAVKDLTALLSFLALPEDDLSLACALRSPLFGWSEQDLYTLAHHRTEKYLWAELREDDDSKTVKILRDLRNKSDYLRPYDLLERILIKHDGRRKLLARLGQEIEDGIDALLSQALAYESTEVPSLTGFLAWMQQDELEIKRQMDSQADQLRVMTVHGSKGLEAPIVILPDCGTRKNDVRASLLDAEDHLIWKPNADASPDSVKEMVSEVQQRQANERLRLLYVAMTRAENWLITAAAGEVDDSTWYNIIEQGMERSGMQDAMSGPLPIKRVAHGDWRSGEKQERKVTEIPNVEPIPLKELDPKERTKTLSPSELGGSKVMPQDVGDGDSELSKTRGTAIHHLLEVLPTLEAEKRRDAGQRILESYQEADQFEDDLLETTLALINQPHLQHIFSATALVEVDIASNINGIPMNGTIDCLIVEPDRVLAIDYKSNRIVPKHANDTPEGLLRQMGAYASALKEIYPDRQIETAILWTETGTLMTLPDELVSAALTRVTVP